MCSNTITQRKPFNGSKSSTLDWLALFDNTCSYLPKQNKRKAQTVALNKRLLALDSDMSYSYKTTLFCASHYEVDEENKTKTHYCKNRSCFTCIAIRKAYLINKYEGVLSECQDLHFVTLTVKNVKGYALRKSVREMKLAFREIKRKALRMGLNADFLRSLEVTYNSEANTFHPHFHTLVDGEIEAEFLKSEWLKECSKHKKKKKGENTELRYPNLIASSKGQDLKKADGGSSMELLKYLTKMEVKSEEDIKALDVIFTALKGLRIVEPYGKFRTLNVDEEKAFENLQKQAVDASPGMYEWYQDVFEYVNKETGECLIFKQRKVDFSFKDVGEIVQRE